MIDDTICAISTSPGNGAISIIRVSGKDAISIVADIFKGKNLNDCESHTINYGYIYDNNEKIDEVLVSVFKAPKTYTTENIVEINCHGGQITTEEVLNLLVKKGCRIAEPGEFTKRAFLNGRIPLTEAEAVNDLLNAKNKLAKNLALSTMSGKLTNHIRDIREKLVNLISNIEVNIDYPEYEDILQVTVENIEPVLSEVKEELIKLSNTAKESQVIKEGIKVALVGQPNVGKSSILNSLINENKAIVTDIAGTTRDIVEGTIQLNNILINFIDTAGIRQTDDIVEKIGVEKSYNIIENSDLNILVLSSNECITDEDIKIYEKIKNTNHIIFVNKNDLDNNNDFSYFKEYITGNTKNYDGLNILKEEIIKKCKLNDYSYKNEAFLTNARQTDLVLKSIESIDEALKNTKMNYPVDMIEIDIKRAWEYLGEITGDNYYDELVDNLFSNFCLGK